MVSTFFREKLIDTPYLTWNSPLVVTFSWFRKSRISDSVAVPPLFIRAIDVLLRAVSALSASTSRCMTASRLFWKVWILGKTSSNWKCKKTENYIQDTYFDPKICWFKCPKYSQLVPQVGTQVGLLVGPQVGPQIGQIESSDPFVISSNIWTCYFSDLENLNFGDRNLLRNWVCLQVWQLRGL